MERNYRFAIIGVAGYIAPRHIKAVQATGNNLVAAHDISDSVGILDSYFPNAEFTTDVNYFEQLLKNNGADFLTVCTPNHFHCRHTLMGLHSGADVICEKPLALSPGEVESMVGEARKTGHKVWTILQLRLHPEIIRLKELVSKGDYTAKTFNFLILCR